MVEVHYPPAKPFINKRSFKIFLAGTIDQGNSIDWQKLMIKEIEKHFPEGNIDIMNPRRPDWDSSWENDPCHPMFKAQVNWELDQLDNADLIIMVLLEESISPVSMLELGYLKDRRMLVFNPEEFHLYGNVEIFCRRNNIPSFHDWDDYLISINRYIRTSLLNY